MKHCKPYLMHMLDEIQYMLHNSKKLEYEEFVRNETLKRSFIRSLEVIGEATKNLPKSFRGQYSHVQWKEIAGLRDILIHHYFGVDYRAIWDIVKNKIPALKIEIEKIIAETD